MVILDPGQKLELPYQGIIHWAQDQKLASHRPWVLLVPFFGAERINLRRHIEFLGEIGFHCVTFELRDSWSQIHKNVVAKNFQFGIKHVWADQIQKMLDTLPGEKIIFSFSNPSASAIEAIARRNGKDIKGLLCDGGPSGHLWKSMMSFFEIEQPVHFLPARITLSTLATLAWHPRFLTVIHQDLQKFPAKFPVLSIRGWKDRIITPSSIDKVFDPHSNLRYQKLGLPQAEHLNGLKDFPEEYKPPVKKFLLSLLSP